MATTISKEQRRQRHLVMHPLGWEMMYFQLNTVLCIVRQGKGEGYVCGGFDAKKVGA